MLKRAARTGTVFAVIGSLTYPVLVFFGLSRLPPAFFVLLGIFLIMLRLAGMKTRLRPSWLSAIVIVLLLGAAYLIAPLLAVKVYPVLVSLSIAAVFAASLFFPPPLVERIARISEPNLPEPAVRYTRIVTEVWVVVLILNAAISLTTALWGTMRQWALWNGLLSYLFMGAVFGAEWLMRKRFRYRLAQASAETRT
jgi:uncharacterized membrane protein